MNPNVASEKVHTLILVGLELAMPGILSLKNALCASILS